MCKIPMHISYWYRKLRLHSLSMHDHVYIMQVDNINTESQFQKSIDITASNGGRINALTTATRSSCTVTVHELLPLFVAVVGETLVQLSQHGWLVPAAWEDSSHLTCWNISTWNNSVNIWPHGCT